MPSVTHLFIKPAAHFPMVPIDRVHIIKGLGIHGDKNAHPLSPRQILITRKEDLDALGIPYGGLRENIIVAGIAEDDFIPGALMIINDTIKIRMMFYCEPCKRIADVVPSLKAVIRKRGVLGVALTDGEIATGNKVICTPGIFAPLSESPYERFLSFVALIPKGHVVTYKTIARGIGVADSFIRAMPKYIEKATRENPATPIHRIISESGMLIPQYIPDQAALLKSENILLTPDHAVADVKKYLWSGKSPYLD